MMENIHSPFSLLGLFVDFQLSMTSAISVPMVLVISLSMERGESGHGKNISIIDGNSTC